MDNSKTALVVVAAAAVLIVAAAVIGYNAFSKDREIRRLAPVDETSDSGMYETAIMGEESGIDDLGDGDVGYDDAGQDILTQDNEATAAVDYTAPDFVALDWDGNEVRLSDYKGVPIVLNFWASWCGPCKAEMADFNAVQLEYSRDELLFLMVNLTDGGRETLTSAKRYVEDNGYEFTVLFDVNQDAAVAYSVASIPTSIFIDTNGDMVTWAQGTLDKDTLRQGIAMLLPEAGE